jgi:hypothetical protein
MSATRRWLSGALAGLLLTACASTSPAEPRGDVGELVASRGAPGEVIPAEQSAESPAEVEARIDDLRATGSEADCRCRRASSARS